MDATTLDLLTKKLKNAPPSVLERVIGYVDALIESNNESVKTYSLSNEQQSILDNQINESKSQYQDAEELHSSLKKKYDL